jgi:hypothetical protein
MLQFLLAQQQKQSQSVHHQLQVVMQMQTFIHANAAYDYANTISAGSVDGVARDIANNAFIKANSAYDSQNTTGSYANSAYAQANTATSDASSASLLCKCCLYTGKRYISICKYFITTR